MLKYLYIKNYVIFEEISLDLREGFSAFTGETGAGKSIMVDAISLLCGQRVNKDVVSKGSLSAIIEGVFDFNESLKSKEILDELGFSTDEDTIITREIKSDGKSVVRINHRVVNLSIVKDLMDLVLDIHSQHDTQYLLKPNNHIHLLDNYINDYELINDVERLFTKYKELNTEMEDSISDKYNIEDIELFEYEINEIENANLKVKEDEEIAEKEKEYASISKNLEKANTAIGLFEGGFQDEFFEITRLTQGFYSQKVVEAHEIISNAYYDVEDAFEKINAYLDNLDISEEDINKLQERSYEINRLKRKYGGSIEEVLKHKEDLINKIEIINNRQEYLDKMQKMVDEAFNAYMVEATKLSDLRISKSKDLDNEVMNNLLDLMLPNAKFKTVINKCEGNKNGIDKVEFFISMNIGEDLKPLSRVASGGELSRLMLGLKTIFSKLQGIKTIIFDEIDTGVSGPVAIAIGVKMRELSKNSQVFSITHLAQVAACASEHYHVSKIDNKERTITNIRHLDFEERVKELAILSSGEATKFSLDAARELLRNNQAL